MKKILFAMVALCAMVLASCSNDDIEIATVGKTHDITLNVGTQGMYDEFGITDAMREVIREDGMELVVTAFLYNEDGNLVDKKSTTLKTFNTVPLTFSKVPEGKYTTVVVETSNVKNHSYWDFNKEDKLSTLEIKQLSHRVNYYGALGVTSTTISVGGNSSDGLEGLLLYAKNVTPRAIGSLLRIDYHHISSNDWAIAGICTQDIIEAYKLDPSLSRNERFVTDITSSNHINVRGYVSVNTNESPLFYAYVLESNASFSFCYQTEENVGTSSWKVFNNKYKLEMNDAKWFYGGLYYNKSDKNNYATIKETKEEYDEWVKSLDDSVIVPELYLTWGASVSAVQSFMGNYTMTMGTTGKAEASSNNLYELQYDGLGKETLISYSFTSATSGLMESDVYYFTSNLSSDEALGYLNKEYGNPLLEQEGTYVYMSADYKTYVMFYPLPNVENAYCIGFVDAEYMSSQGAAAKKTIRSLFAERAKKKYAAHKFVK